LILKEYPASVPVCSEVTARQIRGFGLAQNALVMKSGETLNGTDFEFATIAYPSEMHLWEGLLFTETKRGVFFSSDLMFQMGESHGQVVEFTWEEAVLRSGANFLPSPDMQKKVKDDLAQLRPKFVASGHGPCIRII
jgi:flavorubredoxin